MLITFEGVDGCGKSTQLRALSRALEARGEIVVCTREPGGCPISERIREVVLDVKAQGMSDISEMLLFAAARAQLVQDVIRPALQAGQIVLCDRYIDSSIAYQAFGRGLDMAMVCAINEPALQGCMPDITLLYDIDPSEALARHTAEREPDRIEREKSAFLQRVRQGYRAMAAREPDRFIVFDARTAVEALRRQTEEVVVNRLAAGRGGFGT